MNINQELKEMLAEKLLDDVTVEAEKAIKQMKEDKENFNKIADEILADPPIKDFKVKDEINGGNVNIRYSKLLDILRIEKKGQIIGEFSVREDAEEYGLKNVVFDKLKEQQELLKDTILALNTNAMYKK